MACASRDIIGTPSGGTSFWPHCCPDQPGPGSSSLPLLIERKFIPLRDRSAVTVALISCVLLEVNKKRTYEADFSLEGLREASLALREEHVARLFAFAAAIFHVEPEIVLQNIVAPRIVQLLSRAVDRCRGPLQLDKRPDGRFVEFNQEALGPGFRSWKPEGRAVLFIAKLAVQS